jgi:hypothetical protein
MRIIPGANAVDATIDLGIGAYPYNYGDMTGSVVPSPPNLGAWTITFDSGTVNQEWGYVDWDALVPAGASLTVTASSSSDNVIFSAPEIVQESIDLVVPNGRYLKVSVSFLRASTGESPVLYDLTIRTCTLLAVCEQGPNPAGHIPPADNQDGFWTVRGTTSCGETAGVTLQVSDEGSGVVFPGPFVASGTNVKYVQAPGAPPQQRKGQGVVAYQLRGKGDMVVTATLGGTSVSQTCRVPPPPF